MRDTENPLFNAKVISDTLRKLSFLEVIDKTASDRLQEEVREILQGTQNTSESFIDAYKKISIAAYKIFHEKLDELNTLSVFDETIRPRQLKIEAYSRAIQEILAEMTEYACEKGAILATQAEIEAQLKTLEPAIMETANQAAANSAAALVVRPGWLALVSLGCISNPVTATALAAAFFAAEICKITTELFDLNNNEPTTHLGIASELWSKHSTLSEERKVLGINEALIRNISTKNPRQ